MIISLAILVLDVITPTVCCSVIPAPPTGSVIGEGNEIILGEGGERIQPQ